MNICEECGLPIKACNALAMYRDAVAHFRVGLQERGLDDADRAKEWYDKFRKEQRETR